MALRRAASRPQHGDFDSPKPILQGQDHGLEGKMGLSGEGGKKRIQGKARDFSLDEGDREERELMAVQVLSIRGTGGKAMPLLSAKASSFVTATMLCVSLALILVAPFLSP
ncbi:hypothetical protein OIU85_025491 [Salix viminalis]|uniref:Uncharacterized protein n=1 Tax=Salix viminalis TaxID=40686 RepID=A0A9Q0TLR7_SALVM|nr:hypothetical protein OIU85_025491 [Salix viminalis]